MERANIGSHEPTRHRRRSTLEWSTSWMALSPELTFTEIALRSPAARRSD